jgi:hypothetical protein
MAKTISQRISLEGSEDVKKALEALSAAAAKSAEEVQKASNTGADGFTKTGEAAATAAEGIAKTSEASQQAGGELKQVAQAADKTSESFRGISLESVKTGAEIAKIGAETAQTGNKIERALIHHDSLVQSIVKLGLHASSAVRSLELLGLALGPIAITLGVIGGVAVGAGVALVALEKAATAAAKGYEALNHQLQMLAQTSGTSFESLQKGSAAFEQMGIKSETARQAVVKLDETMKSFDTGAKIKETTDKLIQSEKELLEAKQRADEAGGARMSFNEKMRLLDINKQLENSTTNLGKANEELGTKQSAFATLAEKAAKGRRLDEGCRIDCEIERGEGQDRGRTASVREHHRQCRNAQGRPRLRQASRVFRRGRRPHPPLWRRSRQDPRPVQEAGNIRRADRPRGQQVVRPDAHQRSGRRECLDKAGPGMVQHDLCADRRGHQFDLERHQSGVHQLCGGVS